jgi:hypothetical protein
MAFHAALKTARKMKQEEMRDKKASAATAANDSSESSSCPLAPTQVMAKPAAKGNESELLDAVTAAINNNPKLLFKILKRSVDVKDANVSPPKRVKNGPISAYGYDADDEDDDDAPSADDSENEDIEVRFRQPPPLFCRSLIP